MDDPTDADRARAVIDAYQRETPSTLVVKCPNCGEENPGSFDLCWNCGQGLEHRSA